MSNIANIMKNTLKRLLNYLDGNDLIVPVVSIMNKILKNVQTFFLFDN